MGYKKIEHYDQESTDSLSIHYKEIIKNIGEGEITRIVGRLINIKANMIDQMRG